MTGIIPKGSKGKLIVIESSLELENNISSSQLETSRPPSQSDICFTGLTPGNPRSSKTTIIAANVFLNLVSMPDASSTTKAIGM